MALHAQFSIAVGQRVEPNAFRGDGAPLKAAARAASYVEHPPAPIGFGLEMKWLGHQPAVVLVGELAFLQFPGPPIREFVPALGVDPERIQDRQRGQRRRLDC